MKASGDGFFNYLAEKSALQTVLQFFQMLSGSLQHQLLRTALEGHLRQGVAAHRLHRHHSALAESGVLHLVSLTELDQSHRRCGGALPRLLVRRVWAAGLVLL